MTIKRHTEHRKARGAPSGRGLGDGSPAAGTRRSPLEFKWADSMSLECWQTYSEAMRIIRRAGVEFLLGGGFALATFTGRWRDTKDVDFYIRKRDRRTVIEALAAAGFSDYYHTLPYDRRWIYRSVRSGVIVDTIWAMANQRAQVDEDWFDYADSVTIRGEELKVVPMEEFLWCKLYIMQRDHCDWTDIFNLVYANARRIDWQRLIARMEEDTPLLKGLLTVYQWLCPEESLKLPQSLWRSLKMPPPAKSPGKMRMNRIRLLDSRGWFAALQPKHLKLAI